MRTIEGNARAPGRGRTAVAIALVAAVATLSLSLSPAAASAASDGQARTADVTFITPDLGVAQGGNGQPTSDGRSIFIPSFDEQNVVTVDATTFAPTSVLPALGVNSLLVHDGDLWVARGQPVDAVQRFDLPRSQ